MRQDLNEKLEALRARLMEDEEAWGPESSFEDEMEVAAGEGEAINDDEVEDVLIDYMLSVAEGLCADYEMDMEDAVEMVFDIADQLAEEGSLPFIPEEGDSVAVAEWVGKAKTMGFGELAQSLCDSLMGEED